MKNVRKVELLAPAKDKACALTAINAGADAVYMGACGFGARQNASNPLEDIKEVVEYAHKFNVKVYITVNTIVYDEELQEVQKLIHELYDIGVDALIIQDMGILELDLPPIPLHASTQCNNNSLEKIKFLESCNIERIVLPREFSLKEISEIRKSTKAELEIFIHGALCVCYSGQCYLSAAIGGRSANRGECAQPCRKKYSLTDETGKVITSSKYLLSMKDLSLDKHLEELINSGADSLKIEGRLKDENYVKNVVSYYRKCLDSIDPSLRPSAGILESNLIPDINKTFNRGYTDFNAKGICGTLINPDTPKFTGEKIGRVRSINGNMIETDTKIKLNVSDGISFFDDKNELQGTTITNVNGKMIKLRNYKGLKPGTLIYRNCDSEFSKILQNSKCTRKLPLDIVLTKNDDELRITLNNEFTYTVQNDFERAQNPEKAKENLKTQFSKLGGTEFIIRKIDIDENIDSFIPVSVLNEIRRTFIDSYRIFLSTEYKRNKRVKEYNPIKFPIEKLDYTYNVANHKAESFYNKAGAVVSENAFEKGADGKRLMVSKHCIRRELGLCLKDKKNPEKELFLVDEFQKKYRLEFDCKNCCMKIINS